MSDEIRSHPDRSIEHATCLACGCLCDDIVVEVSAGRIVEARNACRLGRPWFFERDEDEGLPPCTVNGEPVAADAAIDRAAEILGSARSPLVRCSSGSTIESTASALAIADRIGAVVDLGGSDARLDAYQRVGQVSASLGEVKDRADLVIFWGVDPLTTHPRHWERYSVEPKSRFLPGGRADRFVIVVGAQPSATSRAADLFMELDPVLEGAALDWLRARLRGITPGIDPTRRLPIAILESLADRFGAARYGAFFFGHSLGMGDSGSRNVESALRLVRDLNEGRRFVALELGRPGNDSGNASVLCWQSGAPASIDYGLGYPRHLPGEANLGAKLRLGEVDAILGIGADPRTRLDPDLLTRMSGIPSVVLAPGATSATQQATVAFNIGRAGIELGGTVARVDGVMLPLRPSRSFDGPSDREILRAIAQRLGPTAQGPVSG